VPQCGRRNAHGQPGAPEFSHCIPLVSPLMPPSRAALLLRSFSFPSCLALHRRHEASLLHPGGVIACLSE